MHENLFYGRAAQKEMVEAVEGGGMKRSEAT
jgi:hypothetical protein